MSTTTRAGDIAVRSILIMAAGERPDFDELIHPEARNREDVVGPAGGRGRGPAALYASAQWLRGAFEGLSYDEMAEALDCAPGTIASRINRAHAALARALAALRDRERGPA